jgi:hypothetical protein
MLFLIKFIILFETIEIRFIIKIKNQPQQQQQQQQYENNMQWISEWILLSRRYFRFLRSNRGNTRYRIRSFHTTIVAFYFTKYDLKLNLWARLNNWNRRSHKLAKRVQLANVNICQFEVNFGRSRLYAF